MFGQDYHHAIWQLVKTHKQVLINKENQQENCDSKEHNHNTNEDQFLHRNAWKTKFNQVAYLGPYVIIAVRNNGTIRPPKGKVIDTLNI